MVFFRKSHPEGKADALPLRFPHPKAHLRAIPRCMALSYSLAPSSSRPPAPRRVLVTGAAGKIGSYYVRHAPGHHLKRLLVRKTDDRSRELEPHGEILTAPLDDTAALEKACSDIDTVVHLAGDPRPDAGWDDLLEANIKSTYNILAAAKAAGCRRVILASSIHAVSGYSADVQVRSSEPVNPGDLYGVSKCFVEALGRYYAEKEGLSVIALRIGAFQPVEEARKENSFWMMDCFVSHRDLHDLIVKCIDDDRLAFRHLPRRKRQPIQASRHFRREGARSVFPARRFHPRKPRPARSEPRTPPCLRRMWRIRAGEWIEEVGGSPLQLTPTLELTLTPLSRVEKRVGVSGTGNLRLPINHAASSREGRGRLPKCRCRSNCCASERSAGRSVKAGRSDMSRSRKAIAHCGYWRAGISSSRSTVHPVWRESILIVS